MCINGITVFFKNPIWQPKPGEVYECLEYSRYGKVWATKEENKAILDRWEKYLWEIWCPYIDHHIVQ